MSGILLDTCALLDLGAGRLKRTAARDVFEAANRVREVYIPAVVALEIAQKVWAGKLDLSAEPSAWFEQVSIAYGLRPVPLTEAVAFAAYTLPEPFHRDPADRLIVASARVLSWPVVTCDGKILAYARAGHVDAVAY